MTNVWTHMPDRPGYFVTADGAKWLVPTDRGTSVICEAAEPHRILAGPRRDAAKLGIPQKLLDEADELAVDGLIAQLRAGKDVVLDVTPLARRASKR